MPQCLLLHNLDYIHFSSSIKKHGASFYQKQTPKFLRIAKSIATDSEFSKRDIISQFQPDEKKLSIVFSAAKKCFQPLRPEKKEATKSKYTDGKEYFVCTGSMHPRTNPMNLLKAFSIFKNRQQTNMKLVITGRLAWKHTSFQEKIKTYKYRNEVILTGLLDEEEMANVVGSAYALVYPSYQESFGAPVLEAMQCNVPVITSADSSMQEIAGDAALYANPESYEDIAEKMMLLYKDEKLRQELINKGQLITSQFTWDKTAAQLWQTILRATD